MESKEKPYKWEDNPFSNGMYNPFEISICGYSGSGKTTLISSLVNKLKASYNIGYIKTDAHRFYMDKEGKDTWTISKSGAESVYIETQDKSAHLKNIQNNSYGNHRDFMLHQMVIVEGRKHSQLPKIVVLDQKMEILDEINSGKLDNILVYVGSWPVKPAELPEGKQYLQRDDIEGVCRFIENYFFNIVKTQKVNGLVLVGGKSKRMGTSKADLNYHGNSQARYCFDLLKLFCEKVLISHADSQSLADDVTDCNTYEDIFKDMGPIGGILTAMTKDPEAAWLVVACDLPFLNAETIEQLVKNRNPFNFATAYRSEFDGLPEPLCTIWEPKSRARLLHFVGLGITCPRKVLINSNTEILSLKNKNALDNVNNPDEYSEALQKLKTKATN